MQRSKTRSLKSALILTGALAFMLGPTALTASDCGVDVLGVEYTTEASTRNKVGFDEFDWYEKLPPRKKYLVKTASLRAEHRYAVNPMINRDAIWNSGWVSQFNRTVHFSSYIYATSPPIPQDANLPSYGVGYYRHGGSGLGSDRLDGWGSLPYLATPLHILTTQFAAGTDNGDFPPAIGQDIGLDSNARFLHAEIEMDEAEGATKTWTYDDSGALSVVSNPDGWSPPSENDFAIIALGATQGLQGAPNNGTDSQFIRYTLGTEFTDERLKGLVLANLAAETPARDEATCGWSPDHSALTLRRLTYTVRFRGQAGQKYSLSWKQTFYPGDGSSATASTITQEGLATGDIQTVTRTVEPPADNGSIKVELLPQPACALCQAGHGDLNNGSLDLRIDLGRTLAGDSAGSLYVLEKTPTPLLGTRQALKYDNLGRSEIQVIRTPEEGSTDPLLRQIKTAYVFVDIQTISATKYELRLYPAAAASSPDSATGVYTNLVGDPHTVWTIEAPDGTGNTVNVQHQWTINGSTETETSTFAWDDASQAWALVTGNGTRQEVKLKAVNGLDRTETLFIEDGNGTVLSKEIVVYHTYPDPLGDRVSRRTLGEDNDTPLTTQYLYFDQNPSDPRYGRLREQIEPSGFWTKYDYDSQGRVTKVVSQFLDQPDTADESSVRVIEYTYETAFLGGDMLTLDPTTPRRTVEKLKGQVVKKSYFGVFSTGERYTVRCAVPSQLANSVDDLNNTNNLVTIVELETAPGQFTGKTKRIQNPDGTSQRFSYGLSTNDNSRVETVDTVAVYWDPSEGGRYGLRTATQYDGNGQIILQSTKVLLWNDVDPSQPIEGTELSRVTYSEPDPGDPYARPRKATFMDGAYTWSEYGCCGLRYFTDKDGTVTEYGYDDLHRQNSTLVAGIKTVRNLDAAGRLLSTVRYPSDYPASPALTLSSATYDHAGRLRVSRNALGHETHYDPSGANPTLQTTTTYPDSGTRLELLWPDGSQRSVTGTAVFPVQYNYDVTTLNGEMWTYTLEAKLDANGVVTPEWKKTFTDALGRVRRIQRPDHAGLAVVEMMEYNANGQLRRQTDADAVVRLYRYSGLGELMDTAVDTAPDPQKALPAYAGTDRITRTVTAVEIGLGDPTKMVTRSKVFVWRADGADSPFLASVEEDLPGGATTWSIQRAQDENGQDLNLITRRDTTYDRDHQAREVRETAPDGSYTVSRYEYGRLKSVKRYDANQQLIGGQVYAYDAHGRQDRVADLRVNPTADFALTNQITTLTYWDSDQVRQVISPVPEPGAAPSVVVTEYDGLGRVWRVTQPDGATTTNLYFPNGLLWKTSGAHTYPVEYGYDAQGRLKTLKTWRAEADDSTAAVTTWDYDPAQGWLIAKHYPPASGEGQGEGPTYAYSAAGRLSGRAWARGGLATSYTYDNAGDLGTVTYTNAPATPNLTYQRDRLGQVKQVTETSAGGSVDRDLSYTDLGQLRSEASGNVVVESHYDSLLRRDRLEIRINGVEQMAVSYTPDAASRLQTVSDGNRSATYFYLTNSTLVDRVELKEGSTLRLTRAYGYDDLNRVKAIANTPSAGPTALTYAYRYNVLGQRERVTWADNSYWSYQYDRRDQVQSGRRYWSDSAAVAGQQYEYSFDDIGNRTLTKSGGDTNGLNLRVASYSPNRLNQYDQRTVPGGVDVIGTAVADATVTVNNEPAVRHGEYFRGEAVFDNTAGPVNGLVNTVGVKFDPAQNSDAVISQTNDVFLPRTPEYFHYDEDGNLTSDGRWTYTWDGENRLVTMESTGDLSATRRQRLAFEYDWQGRRVRKTVTALSSGLVVSDTRFVYDGWNLIAELDALNAPSAPTLSRSYVWGLDLSGSEQGAGGIGGLLTVSEMSNGQITNSSFTAFDGNGNLIGLLASDGSTWTAQYEYGPFGEVIRATGPKVNNNPFRFSTKYEDGESALVYYGYRYYEPFAGRWLNRDPVAEAGGRNLYAFWENDPISNLDALGLQGTLIGRRGPGPFWGGLGTPRPEAWPSLTPLIEGDPRLSRPPNDPEMLSPAETWEVAMIVLEGCFFETGEGNPYLDAAIKSAFDLLTAPVGAAARLGEGVGRGGLLGYTEEVGNVSGIILMLLPAKCCVKDGGRLGGELTRQLNSDIANQLEQHGWRITGGGGRAPETFLPGPGPGTKGGNFTDITAVRSGRTLHVNTITTLADGVTPSAKEAIAAASIRGKLGPTETLILIPKQR